MLWPNIISRNKGILFCALKFENQINYFFKLSLKHAIEPFLYVGHKLGFILDNIVTLFNINSINRR